ncbi:MAG: hypothetical protein AAF840_18615, partial [Bacteroidota bacterium]
MPYFHRCTGRHLFLFLCLTAFAALTAQTPEALLGEGKYIAAAQAFTARGARADHLQAGLAWYQVDSFARSRAAFQAATLNAAGQEVTDSLTGLALHKMGVICYDLYDDFGAIKFYRRAIAVRDQVFAGAHNDR